MPAKPAPSGPHLTEVREGEAPAEPAAGRVANHSASDSSSPSTPVSNFLPETPSALENGQLIDAPAASSLHDLPPTPLAEVVVPNAVTGDGGPQPSAAQIAQGAGISKRGACATGQQSPANDASDPLDAQQVSEARFDAISQPLLTVVKASRTNWRAAAWLARFLNERRTSTYESTPEEYELQRSQRK